MRQERDNPNQQMDFGNLGRNLQLWYLRRVVRPYWSAKNALHYSLKVRSGIHERAERMTDQFASDFLTCLDGSSINNIVRSLEVPGYQLSLIYYTLSSWANGELQVDKSKRAVSNKTGKAELSKYYVATGTDGGIAKVAHWGITWVVDDQSPRQVDFIGIYERAVLELDFKLLPDRADRVSNLMDYFGKGEGELREISEGGELVDLAYEYIKGSGDWRRNRFVLIGEMTTQDRNFWIYGHRRGL